MRESVGSEAVTVHVGAGHRAYPILIGQGLLSDLPTILASHVDAHRFVIISDHTVAQLHALALSEQCLDAGVDTTLLTFPAGEESKTRKSWSILTDEMLEAGLGRDCCVVAVGGGVTTDLGGFVASTYMRGVPIVQVPTSYLAMIDASVGGKTGVDVRAGKNLVGTFHPPAAVVVDPAVLETLPREERVQGLVEAVKHGAILDSAYFDALAAELDDLIGVRGDAPARAVLRSVELKAEVVTEDELEGGYRQILNFGHTFGHALEAASGFALRHGTAVALGMIAEARLGERLGVTAAGTAGRLSRVLGRLVPLDTPVLDPAEVTSLLASDKKARGGRVRYVFLKDVGEVDHADGWTHAAPDADVQDVLAEALATPRTAHL